MTDEPTYSELKLPNYKNHSTAVTLRAVVKGKEMKLEVPTQEIVIVPALCGLNMMMVSDTGKGKTQLMRDIVQHYFGGNVSESGHANWLIGRKDVSVEDLFREFDKNQMKYVTKEARIRALVNGVDELNRALGPCQNDFFDLAEGERAIDGRLRELGKDGYTFLMAAVNLNRTNGDFEGTSDMDRAFLSRSKINFDFDSLDTTDEDKAEINSQGKAKLKVAPARDISEKILAAFKHISEEASRPEPYIDAYMMIFSAGLDYCKKDELKKKRRDWPNNCGDCDFNTDNKALCAKIKQFEPRTTQTIKRFAVGLHYLLNLREGEVAIDPFDLVFESAKFTAYHGNLNMRELLDTYKGDDQHMMNTVLANLRNQVQAVKTELNDAISRAMNGEIVTKYVKYELNGQEHIAPYNPEFIKKLESKNVDHQEYNPFDALERSGIRMDWLEPYLKAVARRHAKNE